MAITIHIIDEATPTRKARPAGAVAAEVFSHPLEPGHALPVDMGRWRYHGLATRNLFKAEFPAEDTGKTMALVARWVNRKGQSGPASKPIMAPLLVATWALAA